jgi:hypothetical protein
LNSYLLCDLGNRQSAHKVILTTGPKPVTLNARLLTNSSQNISCLKVHFKL